MGDSGGGLLGFLSVGGAMPGADDDDQRVVEFPRTDTGVLPHQRLAEMVQSRDIKSVDPIEIDQISTRQP